MRWLNAKILDHALQLEMKRKSFSFQLECPDHKNGDDERRIHVKYKLDFDDWTPVLNVFIDDHKPIVIKINDDTTPLVEAMFLAVIKMQETQKQLERNHKNHCARLVDALMTKITS